MRKLLTLLVYGLAAALIAACSPATQQSPDVPAASCSSTSGTRMVKDSSGNDVEIPAEVTKVAPTIGAFSAVTAMLGASNKIVAAATSALSPRFKATYPDYEKANPNGYDTKNVEDIIASGAQVVYGPGTLTEEQLAQLKGAGIAFVAIEKLSTVEEMSQAFTIIGNILGGDHQKKAEELVKLYKGNVDDTAKRTASLTESDRVPVLQLRAEGNEYSTINSKDISHEYIVAAGGTNVAADFTASGQGTGLVVGAEQVVAWNPRMIFTLSQESKNTILADPALATVDAVKDSNIHVCPAGVYLWCVRSAEGALTPHWLGKVLHPDLFSDVDMAAEVKAFYKEYGYQDLTDEATQEILAGRAS